jgi:hypothetical protein
MADLASRGFVTPSDNDIADELNVQAVPQSVIAAAIERGAVRLVSTEHDGTPHYTLTG